MSVNPANDILLPPADEVVQIQRDVNISDLLSVLKTSKQSKSCLTIRAAIALSVLLFQKPGHIRSMEWSEISIADDQKSGFWIIPACKTETGQQHHVPLVGHAVKSLLKLQSLTGRSQFVFPAPRDNNSCISNNAVRKALVDQGFSAISSNTIRKIAKDYFHEKGGDGRLMSTLQGLTYVEHEWSVSTLQSSHVALLKWWQRELLDPKPRPLPRVLRRS